MTKKKKAATRAEAMVPAGVPRKLEVHYEPYEPAPSTDYVFLQGDAGLPEAPGRIDLAVEAPVNPPDDALDALAERMAEAPVDPEPSDIWPVEVVSREELMARFPPKDMPAEEPAPSAVPPKNPTYPKKPDYADLPFEVVVVERDPATLEVLHVEVVSRHTSEANAMAHLRSANRAIVHRHRYTAELVKP
jgi:hypothetical protein